MVVIFNKVCWLGAGREIQSSKFSSLYFFGRVARRNFIGQSRREQTPKKKRRRRVSRNVLMESRNIGGIFSTLFIYLFRTCMVLFNVRRFGENSTKQVIII